MTTPRGGGGGPYDDVAVRAEDESSLLLAADRNYASRHQLGELDGDMKGGRLVFALYANRRPVGYISGWSLDPGRARRDCYLSTIPVW